MKETTTRASRIVHMKMRQSRERKPQKVYRLAPKPRHLKSAAVNVARCQPKMGEKERAAMVGLVAAAK